MERSQHGFCCFLTVSEYSLIPYMSWCLLENGHYISSITICVRTQSQHSLKQAVAAALCEEACIQVNGPACKPKDKRRHSTLQCGNGMVSLDATSVSAYNFPRSLALCSQACLAHQTLPELPSQTHPTAHCPVMPPALLSMPSAMWTSSGSSNGSCQ